VLEVGEIGLLALKMQSNTIFFIFIATIIIIPQIQPCEAYFVPLTRPKSYSELALDWIESTFNNIWK
jgi:hypothetical protein